MKPWIVWRDVVICLAELESVLLLWGWAQWGWSFVVEVVHGAWGAVRWLVHVVGG
jgi:hypothetical protein